MNQEQKVSLLLCAYISLGARIKTFGINNSVTLLNFDESAIRAFLGQHGSSVRGMEFVDGFSYVELLTFLNRIVSTLVVFCRFIILIITLLDINLLPHRTI